MSIAIVTGSGGLVGSEAVQFFHDKGFDVIGIDNDMRSKFFGANASTRWRVNQLEAILDRFKNLNIDIRNKEELNKLFKKYQNNISVIIHCAAQPSHDWAATDPEVDFGVNAVATLYLLEAYKKWAPNAVFINMSTNKVYGDTPNHLPLIETEKRWIIDPSHDYAQFGIPETMSIDACTHSLFGVSKVSGDLLVQEYGNYFGLKTTTFRGGCLTGPSHSGAQLHGFLAYLVSCGVHRKPYSVFGYKGKQVRDNIHSSDLVSAFWHSFNDPGIGEVFNIGGSIYSNVSVLEAIEIIERKLGYEMEVSFETQNRIGDHIWYVSDIRKFQNRYPTWEIKKGIDEIIGEIIEFQSARQPKS